MSATMSPQLYGCVLPRSYAAALDSPLTTDKAREAINASVERVSTVPAEIRERLSFGEADVLACLLDRTLPTNKQIGARLTISVAAVHAPPQRLHQARRKQPP